MTYMHHHSCKVQNHLVSIESSLFCCLSVLAHLVLGDFAWEQIHFKTSTNTVLITSLPGHEYILCMISWLVAGDKHWFKCDWLYDGWSMVA